MIQKKKCFQTKDRETGAIKESMLFKQQSLLSGGMTLFRGTG